MADYTKNARTVINGFLWESLNEEEILFADDYRPDGFTKALVPIVPIQPMIMKLRVTEIGGGYVKKECYIQLFLQTYLKYLK
jgi:hypothetical protein